MEPPRRLAPPRLRRGIVPRPRLSRALDRGEEASLTLVVAPAGYGKTVAVETWLAERGRAAAWVRTDARDDDPMRLWSSVAAAVERARPGSGADALASLREPAGAVLPAIEALATGLAADGRLIVIVLEDLHWIRDTRCLGSIDDAVASLPENAQLVLISRNVPRLKLARLQAQGQLAELRARDLAFRVAEAQELFAAVDGAPADAATVAALTERTEGWAAVLYLAALWLRERADPGAALGTFRASDGPAGEYLAGEALGDLDPSTHGFLRHTAVLPQLCGELCDAVLGQAGSRDRLRALELANLLVIPLAERPGWYRYHAVLRDFLLGDLDARDADAVRRRAFAWSLDHGLIEDAAEYARAAGDVGALIAVIEEHALALLRTGRSSTVARWTAAIPRAQLVAHPRALAASLGAAHLSGRPAAEIRRQLVLAVKADREPSISYERTMVHMVRALYTDDHVGEALVAALAGVESSRADGELFVPAQSVAALVLLLAGDDVQAAAAARAALAHPDAASRHYGLAAASAVLAILEARAGHPHTARDHADRALAVRRQAGLAGVPGGAPAQLADAVTSLCEGRLLHAQRVARQAAATMIAGGVWQAWALLELTRIEFRRGRLRAAQECLAHASELIDVARDAGALPALASALGGELDAADAGPLRPAEPLSPAELAVLRLLPGKSVRETADALYLSTNTVKSHVRAIYRKLDVNTREDAVARAVSLGLLDGIGPLS